MASERWDVKAKDVPGGRITRSLSAGLSRLDDEDRAEAVADRREALDRLRVAAGAVDDEDDRKAIWEIVPNIDTEHGPTWDQVLAARSAREWLTLARRSEYERDGEHDAQPVSSELRTMAVSIAEYLQWKEDEEFSANTIKGDRSVLNRVRNRVIDPRTDDPFGERRIATLTDADGKAILDGLAALSDVEGGVKQSTYDDYRKHCKKWLNWEIQKERDRAHDQDREPLFTRNVFKSEESRYSSPNEGRHKTVAEVQDGRRLFVEEADAMIEAAGPRVHFLFHLCRVLGLRPGEPPHLRYMDDVRPLDEGDGYQVDIQGGRDPDPRCGCTLCCSSKGWAPKNGPRTYYLDREIDAIRLITPLCDHIDRWIAMRDPAPGDLLIPSPADPNQAWSNQDMNRKFHAIADELREAGVCPQLVTGRDEPRGLTMHSWRHTCASEMLEAGVPHALAAEWIGDELEEFKDTYGRPKPSEVARATLAVYTLSPDQ